VLDDDLLSFIRGAIRSTWALELLLLARRQAPRAFSPEELVLELRSTPMLVDACRQGLQKSGLLACEADRRCHYAPSSDALAALCDRLASAYAERPMTVINAIVGSPNDRLKSFSDAFRFTKKDE